MSDVEAKFEPYFMGGGEDGTAYYCRNADNATWAALEDSTRDMGLAVGKVNAYIWIYMVILMLV